MQVPVWILLSLAGATWAGAAVRPWLDWSALPALPAAQGLGGPLVGVHGDVLIVGGGANFPEPVWEHDKRWHDAAWVLPLEGDGTPTWRGGFRLHQPLAYAACVSTPQGVACLGGHDGHGPVARCFLWQWDAAAGRLRETPLPSLPQPCAYGAAARIGDVLYLVGGQSGDDLSTAQSAAWRLDLGGGHGVPGTSAWEALPPCPGPPRAFGLAAAQHDGFGPGLYAGAGRCLRGAPGAAVELGYVATDTVLALHDWYRFDPRTATWQRRADLPVPVMAGTAAALGQAHVVVLSGADGTLMARAEALRDAHPGFPPRVWAYHSITDTWTDAGAGPQNAVTTPAVAWRGGLVLASGEIRPRVRTRAVWSVTPRRRTHAFGAVNLVVLGLYLAVSLAVGLLGARRNRDTEDYFRGGRRVVWWAAGCSIFATLLSSITYLAVPAKAYAQDLVYLVGNLMIPVVAPVTIFVTLPLFRRLEVPSAYAYLEQRFNRAVRLFAGASFTLFHVLRMGIVMSLASLALATVTDLSPGTCVLLMGGLSLAYCTLGGIRAVIWTDTLQTGVLLGGVLVCWVCVLRGTPGHLSGILEHAAAGDKLRWVHWHLDPTSTSLALWVVILGAGAQHLSSYNADQAVIQRYLTTPDRRRAARSVWGAALLTVPASLLFFGLGTALFAFYRSHPERLDPTFMTDQILPLFIAREVPVGLAGLIVAGIFAAAQSTVSTSMNSTATVVVSDFVRPFGWARTERAALAWARGLTLGLGGAGTVLGLVFIDPSQRSLFDVFIKVVGLCMGVLGGLFALGLLTRRTGGGAALTGALAGATVMGLLPVVTHINGYLFAAIGMGTCCAVGYGVSWLPSGHRAGLSHE